MINKTYKYYRGICQVQIKPRLGRLLPYSHGCRLTPLFAQHTVGPISPLQGLKRRECRLSHVRSHTDGQRGYLTSRLEAGVSKDP